MADPSLPLQADGPNLSTAKPGEQEAGENPRKKLYEEFRARIDATKAYRRKLLAGWTTNIDMRRGKPFTSQSDEDRINVNLDWSMTKAKQASLFSQVPRVVIDHAPESVNAPWLPLFTQKVNDELQKAGIEAVMDEILPDVINASGLGAVLVAYESIQEDVEVPAIDMSVLPPEVAQQIMQTKALPDGTPLPMTTVPRTSDSRYVVSRISPSDLLWPLHFNGSDFDQAPWIGRSGRVPWSVAKKLFKLEDGDKSKVLGEDKATQDKLSYDSDKDKLQADEMVSFDEIFYWDHQYDETSKSYKTIHTLIYVTGKTDPVVDEAWRGQQSKDGVVVGATVYPIRVLTLTYLTDEAIPPSDTAIGRPQVNEINKSRTQMMTQRERSLPVRWFDVNRVDPAIQTSLMRGTWQAMIPVQGQGTNIIGEIAKANMPQENFAFDKIAKSDLAEVWSVGPNQAGTGQGVDTAGEARVIESNFQTRIGRERAKVGKLFCSVAQVLGGFIALYEDPSQFGQGFDPTIVSKVLNYSILADSTMLLDSNQKLKRLVEFVNFAGKSGWVDLGPVMKEIATLSGLDPSVIKAPQPKPPVEPTISLRLTGVEDLTNPLALAFLMKSGQAPDASLVDAAKKIIEEAMTFAIEQRGTQLGPDGQPLAPGTVPPGGTGLTPGGAIPGAPPAPPITPNGGANPNWEGMPKVNKRGEGDM